MLNQPDQDQLISPTENPYQLASLYRVLFARLFDLVISSIPGIILRALVAVYPGQWGLMMGILFASLGFILLYFMLIPYFLKGQTLGKLVFQIRLKQKGQKTVGFWPLVFRESYFMLIPWAVSVICQVIAIVIMAPYANSDQSGIAPATRAALLLTQLAYVFYVLWLIFVGATIKVQAQHQAWVDLKFNLFVVNKTPLNQVKKIHQPEFKTLTRQDEHVALTEQPGNLGLTEIQDLYQDLDQTSTAQNNSNLNQEKGAPIDE